MPRSRRGRLIGTQLYQNRRSFVAIAGSGPDAIERRFPLDTPRDEIREWQRTEELRIAHARPAPILRGTFDHDIVRHLKGYADRPKLQTQQAQYLAWWAGQRGDDGRRLGSRRRSTFTAPELKGLLAQLAVTVMPRGPYKPPAIPTPATVRHYRTALFSLFTALDGKDGKNPLRDVRPAQSDDPEPRWIPYAILTAILHAMPERGQGLRHQPRAKYSKTRARLWVWTETGLPKKQIEQLLPEHVNWSEPSVLVKGRKKGKGTRTVRLPLTAAAVAALRHFFAIGATGAFSASSARDSWWRAIRVVVDQMAVTDYRAAKALLDSLVRMKAHPYDLRHSFLTDSLLAGGDPKATQDLGQHADGRMMRRYTLAAVDARLVAVVAQLAAHRAQVPSEVPSTPIEQPRTSADSGGKPDQRRRRRRRQISAEM